MDGSNKSSTFLFQKYSGSAPSNRNREPFANHVCFTKIHTPMIRKTIVLTGFLCATVFLSAQQFSFGVRGGFTLSDLLISYPKPTNEYYRPLGGMHAGLDARLQTNSPIAIVAGIQYTGKGYIGKLYLPAGPQDAYWRIHYLNIPVVADYCIWRGLSLQAGIEGGLYLRSHVKFGGEKYYPTDFYRPFTLLDLGFASGLEYRFGDVCFIGLRSVISIIPVQKIIGLDQNGMPLGELKGRNSIVQISVGYRYTCRK